MSLSTQIEQHLKEHWQIEEFEFIGRFKKSANGNTCSFVNLRDINGDLLYFPHIDNTEIRGGVAHAFSPKNFNLKEGEYYRFKARINSQEEFAIRSPLIFYSQPFGLASLQIKDRLVKEEQIKEIFHLTAPNERVARNQANAIKKVTEDAYEEDERFIFELIQNADDTGEQDNLISLSFNFKYGHIVVNHNGVPFSSQDVESITSIGYSSPDKAKNIKKTGYKGIGFKAVFIVADKVVIASGGYVFEFNKNHIFHKQTGWEIENIPWEIQPIWLQKYRLPFWAPKFMPLTDDSTSFLIELKDNNEIKPENVEQDAYKIFKNPRFSLFLRNTAKIEIEGRYGNLTIEKRLNKIDNTLDLLINEKTDSTWITWQNTEVIVPEEVKDSIQDDSTTPKKLKDADKITISFAAKVDKNKIIDLDSNEKVLFTYLPTSVNEYPFPYLVNADFLTILNRQSIKTKKAWNLFLFREIGFNQFKWAINLWNENSPFNYSLLKLIFPPFEEDTSLSFGAFNEGFEKGISELSFIPTISNELKKIEDIIVDETGVSALLGVEGFNQLVGEGHLIHPKVKGLRWLKNQMEARDVGEIFSWESLENNISELEQWLHDPTQNAAFLNFIAKSEKIELFEEHAIVLDQNGDLKCYNELYHEIPEDDLKLLSFLEFSYLNEKVKNLLDVTEPLPLKIYLVEQFVEEVILVQKKTVDDKIEDFQTSIDFYYYLASNQSELSDSLTEELTWFQFFDIDKEIHSSIDGENIYFENEAISMLWKSKCLPKYQILTLPKEYLGTEDALSLWQRFGVKTLDENNAAAFIQEEICEKFSEINDHFQSLIDVDEDSYKIARKGVVHFLEKYVARISSGGFEQLKCLNLFHGQDGFELCAKDMNLFFEEKTITVLLQAKSLPEGQIYILPKAYLISENGSTFWSKLGVKTIAEAEIAKFIQEEICEKTGELDKHFKKLVEEDNGQYHLAIKTILQFVEKHIEKLSSKDFDQFKELDLFLDQDELESYPSGMNLYFEEKTITTLLQAKSLPEGQIYILPKTYLISENSSKLWRELGVKTLGDEEIAQFIKEELCENVVKINAHSSDLNSENVETCLGATKALLEFYIAAKTHLSPSEIDLIRSKMAEIFVLNSDEGLTPIKNGYISNHYTGKTDIEDLLDNFPGVELSFISNHYTEDSSIPLKEWKSLLVELGARNDNIEFIKNSMIPHFGNINEDNIVSATKLLFENRKLLEDELLGIEDFPVLTKDGSIVNACNAILGSHFLQEGIVKLFVDQIEFEDEISSLYTKDKIDKWTEFFHSLGVPKKEEEEFISEAINLLIECQELFEQEEKHYQLFNSVLEIHGNEQLLSSDYAKLQEWKLMCYTKGSNQIHFTEATSILFSNAYNPKIRFEDFDLNEDLFFLSEKYLHENSNTSELIGFFKELGVRGSFIYNRISEMKRDNMPSDYVEWIDGNYPSLASESINYNRSHLISSWVHVPFLSLIVNPVVNVAFWELAEENSAFRDTIFNTLKYKKYNSIQNVESEPLWYIREHETVPNLNGELFRPGELYAQSLKDIIKDNSKISSINFESIESSNFENLAEALNLKTELDFIACLNIIKRQESHNWLKSRNVISKLEDLINEELTDEERNAFDEFKESGNLLSQTLQWLPIAKLHTVVTSFKLGITKSHYLLHEDFKNLYEEFDIKELEADDFEFDPKEKREDTQLPSILKNRAKFLAFLANENEWEEVLSGLLAEIEKFKFYTCKKISLTYKNGDVLIENSDFDFFNLDGSDDYYFIGRWDRVRAAEMYPYLYKRLDLKHPVSEKVFKDILFAESEEDILDYFAENNIVLSKEINPRARELEPVHSEEEISSQNQENSEEDKQESLIEDLDSTKSGPQMNEKKHPLDVRYKDNQEDNELMDAEGYSVEKEGLITGRKDLSPEEQREVHDGNVAASRHFLEQKGYDFSESDDEGYKTTNVISPDGTSVDFIFRSASGGLLHVNSYHWEELDAENTLLLVGYPGNEFKLFKSKMDLLENELNNNLLFRILNSRDELEVDKLFQSLDDKDGQLILVTSQEMKAKLYEQFKNQKDNKPLSDVANIKDFDY